jgi:16S rRNA (adenine(1408)-N(1))-methyltransferase
MARARVEPGAFVLGIDASAAAMAEVSRRAARPAERGGAPNALFVVAAAERPPIELLGIADELTINFPWGSLLRGALACDDAAARGIAALLKPRARLKVLVSVTARDALDLPAMDEPGAAAELAGRWADYRLRLDSLCPATEADVAATRSSWARRLAVGRERPAWRIVLRRVAPGEANDDLEFAG